jgi:hypothetical protein
VDVLDVRTTRFEGIGDKKVIKLLRVLIVGVRVSLDLVHAGC